MNYLKSLPIPLEDEEDQKNDHGGRKNNHQVQKNDQEVREKNYQGQKKDQLNYVIRHVHLPEVQLRQIAEGFSRKKSVKLPVSLIRNKDSAQNEQKLPLTRYQIKKINKGEGITLSVKQLEHVNKEGGFLPAIPAIIAAATAAAPIILKGIHSWQNKKANDALVAERRRLNDALIDEKKRVSDAKIAKLNEKGESLYMNRKPKILGESVKPQSKKSKKHKGAKPQSKKM